MSKPYIVAGTGNIGRVVVRRKSFRAALRQATKFAKIYSGGSVFAPGGGTALAKCTRVTMQHRGRTRRRRVIAECQIYAKGRLILKREKAR